MFTTQSRPTWGTGGFGGAPAIAPQGTSGMFGAPQTGLSTSTAVTTLTQPQAACQAATAAPNWQNFARQSALASYLNEFDKAYNALHPQCRFRAFVYNACGAGQALDAIQRERYIAFLHGGGCTVEDYAQAQRANPDSVHLYPSPVHFMQELQQRVGKQRGAIEQCARRAQVLLQDVKALLTVQEDHHHTMRTLRAQEAMLRGRWLTILHHCELLRRMGCDAAQEGLLLQRVQALREQLATPGQYRDALTELQPYVTAELRGGTATAPRNSDGNAAVGAAPLLRPEVDVMVLRDWLAMAHKTQSGIEALHNLLERDLSDMRAVRLRCST